MIVQTSVTQESNLTTSRTYSPTATQRKCFPHEFLRKLATLKFTKICRSSHKIAIWEVRHVILYHIPNFQTLPNDMSQLTFLQPQFLEGSSLGRTTCATFIKRRSSTAWSRIPASSTGLEFTLLIRSATFCTTDGPFLFPSTR